MPTYEYICSKCDHQFDFFQPISEKPIATCPKEVCPCKPWGKGKVKRGIGGGAGFIFKGSGFYITDYRSENYKQSAKKEKDSAAPAKAESKSESKSDSSSGSSSPSAKSPPAKATPSKE